jgi:hypothetical protein
VTTGSNGSVQIEILAREDCPNRGMALVVVERVVGETGIPAEIEVVDLSDDDAEEYRVLGSPTVLVDGRDVDPQPTAHADFSVDDRIYRTERGPCGWPDAEWIRNALLRAVAQTTSNGKH